MKLCVYGIVDTNVICHMCKMNYVTHTKLLHEWIYVHEICIYGKWISCQKDHDFDEFANMDDNVTCLKFDNMGEIKFLDDNFSSYIFVEEEVL